MPGFLRTGARTVFAEGTASTSYILYGLFKTNRTMKQIFWTDPARSGAYDFSFVGPDRGSVGILTDGRSIGRYYRSVDRPSSAMTAASWR